MFKMIIALVFSFLVVVYPVYSAWQYPGCDDVAADDFREVTVIGKGGTHNPLLSWGTLHEPIEMDFDMDNEGNVDIYFVQRRGDVVFYDASENAVNKIGDISVNIDNEMGLVGIALDPNFKENRWIYLFYCPVSPDVFRLSRFTLNDGQISSEQIFIEIPIYRLCCHTAGSMTFDAYGDLWVSIGKNSKDHPGGNINESDEAGSTERTSSNTATLTGGVIRIHPLPTQQDGKWYSIPDGNFGEYFSEIYPDRADEFLNPDKVAPEIFAKGMRNPYTLAVQPYRRWLVWGENGINMGGMHEEHNFTKVPGFFGYPYFAGDPELTKSSNPTYSLAGNKDPNAPTNTSKWNKGISPLPPALPGIHTYIQSSAMTGPVYVYDPDLDSDVKFPPHFNNVWFITDFNEPGAYDAKGRGSWFRALKIDTADLSLDDNQEIFSNINLRRPIDVEQGPDGAMYVISYAGWFSSNADTRISRIEYTGPKCEVGDDFIADHTGCLDDSYTEYDPTAAGHDPGACGVPIQKTKLEGYHGGVLISPLSIDIKVAGKHDVRINDVRGREVFSQKGEGAQQYPVKLDIPGVYVITVSTVEHTFTKKLIRF